MIRFRTYDEIDSKLEGIPTSRLQEALRDRGGTETLTVQTKLDPRHVEDSKYEAYMRERMSKQIGFELLKEGLIKFTSETERDLQFMETIKTITGKVEICKLK